MADQWYYGAGGERHGPFSARQLQELAADGRIRPSDTVWKEGIDQGVLAHKVRNLFLPAQAGTAPVQSNLVETNPPSAQSPGQPSPTSPTPDARRPEVGPTIAEQPGESAPALAGNLNTVAPSLVAAPEEDSGKSAEEPITTEANAATQSEDRPDQAKTQPTPQQQSARKGRAVVIRGAVIDSQDGITGYFRKKCTECGFVETGRNRLNIRIGLVTRLIFRCPRCRKSRKVEITCVPG